MRFSEVAEVFTDVESKSGRIEMTRSLSELFKRVDVSEIDKLVYLVEGILAPPYFGIDLGLGEKFAISAVSSAYGFSKKEVEDAYRDEGDLGLVAEKFAGKKKQASLSQKEITVAYLYDQMVRIAKASGTGSQDMKIKILTELLNNASPVEAKYIVRFVTGELRLGVGEPTILDALSFSRAGDKSLREELDRAYNLSSDLGYVAKIFFEDPESIRKFSIQVFRPLMPALAERLSNGGDIVEKIGPCAIEFKFDGFRVQCHKKGGKVEIYSRKLEVMTPMFPDVVEAIRKLKTDEIIFEGEALAFNEKQNRFFSFQETMHRRRKHGVENASKEFPLYVFAFDIMHLDGEDLTLKPYSERRKMLESVFPSGSLKLSERKMVETGEEIERIFEDSTKKGLEGIMAKDLNAPYTAGKRKFAWIKLKKSYGKSADTIDAVVVGYYLGKGARVEFEFGGLLVAVKNEDTGRLETVAKIGSGFSEDEMRMLKEMLEKITAKSPPKDLVFNLQPDFWVKPKYVVETGFDDITVSPNHTCLAKEGKGLALRFPRMLSLREDKSVQEITTSQEVSELHELLHKSAAKKKGEE